MSKNNPDVKRNYDKKYRAANRDRIRSRHKAWRDANRGKLRVKRRSIYLRRKDKLAVYRKMRKLKLKGTLNYVFSRKLSAKRDQLRGSSVPFDLTMAHMRALYKEQDGKCAVSGRSLIVDTATACLDSLSIDRIESKLGYVIGNVRFVTWQANAARLIGTDEELLSFCRDVVAWLEQGDKNG